MTDIVIVGAGLTGLIAAHTAARAGLRTKIIAKGLGALHWNAGAIDLLGYYPDDDSPVVRPFEAIQDLRRKRPLHPYAVLGEAKLRDALSSFIALTDEIRLPYRGSPTTGDNLWLPSPVGAARPTFLAPQAQLAGDLARPEPMLIVGFEGMRDFYPEMIAENLAKQGHRARPAFLPLSLVTERHDRINVHLTEALDSPERQTALAEALSKIVRPSERIGLPAILGMENHAAAFNRLQEYLGVPVFEIPTLPPSVPGIRLNTALRHNLAKLGVRVDLNADVTGYHAEGDRLIYLETESSGRPLLHHAERFILATGGILGGGIDSNHSGVVREVILDLPVSTPSRRAEWFRTRFFDAEGHPIFRAGVTVNNQFQPVGAKGECIFNNVWAAGCLLANADPILERSHEGIGVATGAAAATLAADPSRALARGPVATPSGRSGY